MLAGDLDVVEPLAVQFGDDFVVLKYDPAGTELWAELVDGGESGTDLAAWLDLDAAGNPYVAGRMLLPPGDEWQAAVVKLTPEGAVEWTGSAGHPASGIPEVVHCLTVAGDGTATLVATGSDDVLTARFDPAGSLVWDHLHDGVSIASVAGRPLAVDAAGNAYVAAQDFLPGRGYDFLTYRLEAADGALGWVATYGEAGETADDFPAAVAVDPLGHVLVGGSVRPGGASLETDWAVVAYSGLVFSDGFESGDLSGWSASDG